MNNYFVYAHETASNEGTRKTLRVLTEEQAQNFRGQCVSALLANYDEAIQCAESIRTSDLAQGEYVYVDIDTSRLRNSELYI